MFDTSAITEMVDYQGGSIMVWGFFRLSEVRTDIVVLYRGSVFTLLKDTWMKFLQDHVMPFTLFIGDNFR